MTDEVLVVRGRRETVSADQAVSTSLADRVASTGIPAVRVWSPPRQLAFGPRDRAASTYEAAAAVARTAGYPPTDRAVGGRAVALTGTTVAVLVAEPVSNPRTGVEARYQRIARAIQRGLWAVGVPAQVGEPEGAFCPGSHSLSCGGKIAGVAQRVRADAALVAGVVLVEDDPDAISLLGRIYDVLSLPIDPAAIGSVEAVGGAADPNRIVAAIESRLIEDRSVRLLAADQYG